MAVDGAYTDAMTAVWTLGVAADPTQSMRGVFLWGGALIGLCLVGFAGYSVFRRWMSSDAVPSDAGRGFTLSDLRDLHRQANIDMRSGGV